MSFGRFTVDSLGEASIANPIGSQLGRPFTTNTDRILFRPTTRYLIECAAGSGPESLEMAGARELIYFRPAQTKAAIVTCGGLCPGINAVIRALVMQLWYRYRVRNIIGIRYGYQGLGSGANEQYVELTPQGVGNIHEQGGTILGSSRGTPPVEEIVDSLQRANINILFTIGGDGTMAGALAISELVKQRGLKIAIVGIPKTIDNDIPFVWQSFGFETAVSIACQAAHSAHNEARGFQNGIGLVKLMGRHSGYIAANTTLAAGHINFCLIPEIPFQLEGPNGLLTCLEKRFEKANHALIIVAEGSGQQNFINQPSFKDQSGNQKLGDIGLFLRDAICLYFRNKKHIVNLKYIDPSYLIRSAPANPSDSLFCAQLAQMAVHGAMAGKTGMLVGYWHGHMSYVPMKVLAGSRRTIHPAGDLWFNVLESTGQPASMGVCPTQLKNK